MLVKELLQLLEGVDPNTTVYVDHKEEFKFACSEQSGIVDIDGPMCDREGNILEDQTGAEKPFKAFIIVPCEMEFIEG